jgi:hypothetical protein
MRCCAKWTRRTRTRRRIAHRPRCASDWTTWRASRAMTETTTRQRCSRTGAPPTAGYVPLESARSTSPPQWVWVQFASMTGTPRTIFQKSGHRFWAHRDATRTSSRATTPGPSASIDSSRQWPPGQFIANRSQAPFRLCNASITSRLLATGVPSSPAGLPLPTPSSQDCTNFDHASPGRLTKLNPVARRSLRNHSAHHVHKLDLVAAGRWQDLTAALECQNHHLNCTQMPSDQIRQSDDAIPLPPSGCALTCQLGNCLQAVSCQ